MKYLRCPGCSKKRVTRRDFSDGAGYACDRCHFSVYIEEEGDQDELVQLAALNPAATVQLMYREVDETPAGQ